MRSKLWIPLLLGVLFSIRDFDDGAARADVRDMTATFSQEAVQQANKVIDEIHQKYGRDVVVEVLPTPGGQNLSDLALSRARQADVNGIYIIITREPGNVLVWVHNDAAKAITPQDRDQLRDRLVQRFRARQFDQGLLDGVNYIRQTFFANLGPRSAQPAYNAQYPPAGGGSSTPAPPQQRDGGISWFWWLLIIGLGLFLLMRIIRQRRQAYSPGYGTLPGQPGNAGPREPYSGQQCPGGATGAGGWGRGMLGGLMGGMAGGWLYDRMRGGGAAGAGGSAYGDPGSTGGTPGRELGAGGSAYRDPGGAGDTPGGEFGGESSHGSFDDGGGDFGGDSSSGEF